MTEEQAELAEYILSGKARWPFCVKLRTEGKMLFGLVDQAGSGYTIQSRDFPGVALDFDDLPALIASGWVGD